MIQNTQIITILEGKTLSSKEIFELLAATQSISYATVKRALATLVDDGQIVCVGKGKASRYQLSQLHNIVGDIDVQRYFEIEIDQRKIIPQFNFDIFDQLKSAPIFTASELGQLQSLQNQFATNVAQLTATQYKADMERLAIDLSWKSSQIEGNTYSLLETERLIIEKQTASGKTQQEATMLLNHKVAIDFMVANVDYLSQLSVAKIENIHSMLVQGLDVERNIRVRRVGITGTAYCPLDNEFQIKEAIEKMCSLVNNKVNIFEKAFLLLVLISYIQPFADGNKRTARIVSNAQLMANEHCPLSFRTVDSIEYKKAMLIFYERNNISAFKRIFIEQFTFAVNTYF